MTSERWAQVERLYHAARERAEPDRAVFLAEACADDEFLRREVESLLAEPASGDGFLEAPAMSVAAHLVSDGGGSVLIGRRLGVFQVKSRLGAGGMGEVYRAYDTRLKREVALKVLPGAFSQDRDRLARFQREAELLATLNHPNIAAVYGLERADPSPGSGQAAVTALILELVEGETLADRLARGSRLKTQGLPLDEALPIARQIADALEAAHEKGIIHRDLKPANIKVTADGRVKVLDFGLAKLTQASGSGLQAPGELSESPTITPPALMTEAGIILGTAAYMSPEQARGKAVDKRTDIWAFGCVLYEMLTGRRAFEGDDVSAVLARILEREPDMTALPSTPPAILRLLRRSLEKDRKRRLSDISDARLEIDEALTVPLGEAAIARNAVKKHPLPWVAAGALLVLSIVLGAIALSRKAPDPAATVSFEVAPPSAPGPLMLTVSPDGKYVSAIVSSEKGLAIWLRALDGLDAQIVNGSEDAVFPFWSPDSRFLAFFAGGKLKKVDVSGGQPQILCDTKGYGGTWNRAGVIVFNPTTEGPLFRVSAAGGVPVQLTSLDAARQETAHRQPYFLPDGQHFLFTVVSAKSENSGIYVGSLDSQDRRHVVSSGLKAAFVPPNRILFVQHDASALQPFTAAIVPGGTLMAQAFDPKRLEILGDPSPIAEVAGNFGNSAAGYAVSEGGVLAYRTIDPGRVLQWYDRTGKQLGTVDRPARWESPSVSPDLQRLAVLKREGPAGDLWILEQARGMTTRLTFDPATDDAPVWSPEGNRIVFTSRRSSRRDLYVKNSGGTGQDELLLRSDHGKIPDDWSADGRFILYRDLDPKTGSDLWILPLTGDRKPHPVLTASYQELQGRFSPDGRWMAYVSNESGGNRVFVQSFPPSGSKWQISTGDGVQPRWRRDGKELFFMGSMAKGSLGDVGGGVPSDVMAVDVDVSNTKVFKYGVPRKLFTVVPHSTIVARNSWDVTPDGQRFLVVVNPTAVPPVTVVINWLQGLNTHEGRTP